MNRPARWYATHVHDDSGKSNQNFLMAGLIEIPRQIRLVLEKKFGGIRLGISGNGVDTNKAQVFFSNHA